MRCGCLALLLVTTTALAGSPGVRDENLHDREVEEIRAAVYRASNGQITSIGTVKTGCDCEENGTCSDHVDVSLQISSAASLLLTAVRVDGVWRLSRHSLWQLDLDKLNRGFRARIASLPLSAQGPVRAEYFRKVNDSLRERPRCRELRKPVTSPASSSPSR